MRKIKILLSILIIFNIGIVAMAQENETDVFTTYIGYVDSTAHMVINISNLDPGNVVYVEDYYQIDSSDKPNFYASRRFEKNISGDNLSFDLYRPSDRHGSGGYTFVDIRVLNNKVVTFTRWFDLRNYWKL